MDKIEKALQKFSQKEVVKVKQILLSINTSKLNCQNFDLKKLKGKKDIYRIRCQKIRIIFYKKDNDVKILAIERRSDITYK